MSFVLKQLMTKIHILFLKDGTTVVLRKADYSHFSTSPYFNSEHTALMDTRCLIAKWNSRDGGAEIIVCMPQICFTGHLYLASVQLSSFTKVEIVSFQLRGPNSGAELFNVLNFLEVKQGGSNPNPRALGWQKRLPLTVWFLLHHLWLGKYWEFFKSVFQQVSHNTDSRSTAERQNKIPSHTRIKV